MRALRHIFSTFLDDAAKVWQLARWRKLDYVKAVLVDMFSKNISRLQHVKMKLAWIIIIVS